MRTDLNNFQFSVVPQEELDEIKSNLEELKSLLQQKTEEEKNSEWIESTQIPKILNISRKTYQSWRDQRLLSFSQIGSKIYICRSDLEKFMQDHKIESRQ